MFVSQYFHQGLSDPDCNKSTFYRIKIIENLMRTVLADENQLKFVKNEITQ